MTEISGILGAIITMGLIAAAVPTVSSSTSSTTSPSGSGITYAYSLNQCGDAISEFRLEDDGTLTKLKNRSTPTGYGSESLAVTPGGRHMYAAAESEATISEFQINRDGALETLPAPRVRTGEFPVSVHGNGKAVYVACRGGGAHGIWQFSADAFGKLTPSAPPIMRSMELPQALVTSPEGRFLYFAGLDDRIYEFRIDERGALSPLNPAFASLHKFSWVDTLEFNPNGQALFVVDAMGNTLDSFIVMSNGDLTSPVHTKVGDGLIPSLSLAFDGPFAYVANGDDHAIYGYRIGPGAHLAPLDAPPVKVPAKPSKLVVAPDGQWLFLTSDGSRRLRRYRMGQDGRLSPFGEQILEHEPKALTFVER